MSARLRRVGLLLPLPSFLLARAGSLERNAARARAPRLAHARAPEPDTMLTSAPLRGAAGGGGGRREPSEVPH